MSQETVDSAPSSRRTRLQEKDELASLNDRFLAYKEKLRADTNKQLKFEVEQATTQVGKEIKKLYENELADARRLIDETAKEKARQQLNASKNASRVNELEAELKQMKEELDSLKGRVAVAERNAASLDAQRKAAFSDRNDAQKHLKDLEAERDDLRANVDELRAALEHETLQKVDHQNHAQSLMEELTFKQKIHEEEVHNIRVKSSVSFSNANNNDLSDVEFAIDELRETSDMRIDELKAMLEASFRDRIDKYEKESIRDASTITQLKRDLANLGRSLQEKAGDNAKLLSQIEKLEALCDTKDAEANRLRQRHTSEKILLTEDIRALRENYEAKLKEYEELLDLKVQLDQEIATYRALLSEEEERMNLTPTPRKRRKTQLSEQPVKKTRVDTPVPAPVPSRAVPTRAMPSKTVPSKMVPSKTSSTNSKISSSSSSAAGCVQIFDVDPDGRFVIIKNLSTSTESIGGFKIVHEVEGGDDICFKFHQKSKLQGGASVTVWGSEANGAVHSPPQQIIWRNQPTWGAGSTTVTKLVNKNSEVVASFTSRVSESLNTSGLNTSGLNTSSSPILSFPRIPEESVERRASTTTSPEHMFHQRGDPPPPPPPPQGGRHPQRDTCNIS